MVFNFLFLLSLSSPANAGSTLPYQVCPALTDDAKKIGERIEKLRNAIKKTEDCKSIPEDLALVKELITTPAWKDIKESMKSGAVQLEGAKLNTINDLVTRASSSLSEVVTRIAGAKECYDKKDEDLVLSSISGITREVSGVISAVTGPYGAAVSMGGNILGSAIEGIVKLVKSLSSYKFKKLEDENLFVDQFCAFADIQRDINDNLNSIALIARESEIK